MVKTTLLGAVALWCVFYGNNEVSGTGTWWTIVSMLAAANGAQFLFIKKLYGDLKRCNKARLDGLETKLRMVRSAKEDLE
jgi:hypothetical protein